MKTILAGMLSSAFLSTLMLSGAVYANESTGLPCRPTRANVQAAVEQMLVRMPELDLTAEDFAAGTFVTPKEECMLVLSAVRNDSTLGTQQTVSAYAAIESGVSLYTVFVAPSRATE